MRQWHGGVQVVAHAHVHTLMYPFSVIALDHFSPANQCKLKTDISVGVLVAFECPLDSAQQPDRRLLWHFVFQHCQLVLCLMRIAVELLLVGRRHAGSYRYES